MTHAVFAKLLLTSSIALALAACGGDNNQAQAATPAAPVAAGEPGDVFAISTNNKLISFNRDAPATVRTSVTVSGLQGGESIIGIDFRPADGQLYGVGSSGRIYTINTASGAATFKAALVADAADTSAPFTGLAGSDFGIDFNPVADRLRVVGNSGQSLRINVDTGATTTDGNINGGPANSAITGSAYTNAFATTGSTTLFAIDTVNGMLYTQNPPNNGTLSLPVRLGVTGSSASGFDIDARTNTGYAIVNVSGVRSLYTINLAATTNAATLAGAIGVQEDIRGIALRTPPAPLVYGLTDAGRLVGFKPLTPNTLDSNIAITGLAAGDRLLGFDVRPKDGLLYGITAGGRIVTIDTATGAATTKATLAADAADTSAPYTAIAGTSFAVDFNPVADRLRVISNTGQSLRINADTGATTTDGAINRAGASPIVAAGAYTNSYAGTTATALFDLDAASGNLALQNPPNDGTLANVGALGLDVIGDAGFDIAGGANGLALAGLRSSATGPASLYRVDLATGAATLVNGSANPALSAIGTGVGLRDLAIMLK